MLPEPPTGASQGFLGSSFFSALGGRGKPFYGNTRLIFVFIITRLLKEELIDCAHDKI